MPDNKTVTEVLNTPKTPVSAPAAPPVSLEELGKQILALQSKINEKASLKEVVTKAEIAPPKEPEIDWTKVEEKDVFNLSVPIPAIEQEVPDYLNIHVLDKNYITRWIHKLPERLGTCLVSGYSYVQSNELDPRYPLALQPNSEGHFCYSDVVCLKILKSRYFAAIRRNYEKTMAVHGKNSVRSKIGQQIANASPKLESAIRRGAISFYDEEATEESGPDLEAVTL
jgi:hypothetical protein